MSNKVYVLQVSDGEDPKLLSKIITTESGNSDTGHLEQPVQYTIYQYPTTWQGCESDVDLYLPSLSRRMSELKIHLHLSNALMQLFRPQWMNTKLKYEMRGEMADLLVAVISTFFMLEEFNLHILKWRSDDTIVFKHNTASWCSWRSRSWITESSPRHHEKDR